jgi:hypothetical protein
MVVLLNRIGRALFGVLIAAGIVVAIAIQNYYFASVLALWIPLLAISTVWREQSHSTTQAQDWLQRRDPSAVVFVSGRPEPSHRLESYSTSGSPLRLPTHFPVVADAAGISFYSRDRSPTLLALIPWSSIEEVELSDGYVDTKVPLLSVVVDGRHGVAFYVRSRVKGLWDVKSDSQGELLRDVEAKRALHHP